MKFSTAALLLIAAIFLLIAIPEKVLANSQILPAAQPHEEYQRCGTTCENTCADPQAEDECSRMCKKGYFCESGYIREHVNGPCILPSDCPPTATTPRSV